MTELATGVLWKPFDASTLFEERPVSREPRARQALEALYRSEHDSVLAYFATRIDRDRARDLTQEVFVRAATSPQLTDLHNPRGFLRRIACNLLADRARRRRCRIATTPLIDERDGACCADQEDGLHARQAARVIARALADLPEKTARIFAMHRFEKKSYRQIHRELGIALPTVEYHMMKALARVRTALSDDHPVLPKK